jgi:hypothetical protein
MQKEGFGWSSGQSACVSCPRCGHVFPQQSQKDETFPFGTTAVEDRHAFGGFPQQQMQPPSFGMPREQVEPRTFGMPKEQVLEPLVGHKRFGL